MGVQLNQCNDFAMITCRILNASKEVTGVTPELTKDQKTLKVLNKLNIGGGIDKKVVFDKNETHHP